MALDVRNRKSDPHVLRIAGFLKRSSVNGPGIRSVVWVQGCPIRCEGCFNPALWDENGGRVVAVHRLSSAILSTAGIDGVTFSGGEPFFQAEALANLAEAIRSHELSVVTFSGYPYDLIAGSRNAAWIHLLDETDLLISGPYPAQQASNNNPGYPAGKEFHFLTGRIRPDTLNNGRTPATVEYTISADGTVLATGFPGPALGDRIHALGIPRGF